MQHRRRGLLKCAKTRTYNARAQGLYCLLILCSVTSRCRRGLVNSPRLLNIHERELMNLQRREATKPKLR